MISANYEIELIRRMIKSQMCTLVPETDLARAPDNSLLRGGWFAVPHRKGRLRLIFDRRSLNEGEYTQDWGQLPHGTEFCKLIVDPGTTVRGSGDDLSNFVYQWKHNKNWLHRQAVGRRVSAHYFMDLIPDLDVTQHYRCSLKVIAMGDTNGVGVTQSAHVGLLEQAGCMRSTEVLSHGLAAPLELAWEGVYIDDRIAVLRLPRERLHCSPKCCCRFCQVDGGFFRDVDIMNRSRAKYRELDLPLALDKQFNLAQTFEAWGTTVEGHAGRAGVSSDKLRLLFRLLLAAAGLPTTRTTMQALLGSVVHPYLHRRCCMATLSEAFSWSSSMSPTASMRMPANVIDEVIISALWLPLAHTNVRHPVSRCISATDSSGKRGGSCIANVPQPVAELLFARSEFKGEAGRLDWNFLEEEFLSENMTEPDADLNELLASLPWKSPVSYEHKGLHHINTQEVRAVLDELERRAFKLGQRDQRVVCAIDSRVAVGCVAKGRSSSKALNSWLRKLSVLTLSTGLCVRPLWVGTKYNPADDPSRGVQLRPASPCPSWASHLWKPRSTFSSVRLRSSTPQSDDPRPESFECAVCDDRPGTSMRGAPNDGHLCLRAREYYGGAGGLTKALCRKQVECMCYEAYGKDGYNRLHDMELDSTVQREVRAARRKVVGLAHFGITCGSWSTLNNLNGGTRSSERPFGDGVLEREINGNFQHDQTFDIIDVLIEEGIGFSVENPLTSFIWHTPLFQELLEREDIFVVDFDQCAYCLRPPDAHCFDRDTRVLKRTRVVTNVPQLQRLRRCCDKGHDHVATIGFCRDKAGRRVRRSTAAGVYPPALCRAWAEAVREFLVHGPRS